MTKKINFSSNKNMRLIIEKPNVKVESTVCTDTVKYNAKNVAL